MRKLSIIIISIFVLLLSSCDILEALLGQLNNDDNNNNTQTNVRIISPNNGDSFAEGITVKVKAEASSDDGIDEVRNGAEQLGVDADEIDFDDAEAARDAANEAEDREAEMHEEERLLDLHAEREADNDIDDILDSIAR